MLGHVLEQQRDMGVDAMQRAVIDRAQTQSALELPPRNGILERTQKALRGVHGGELSSYLESGIGAVIGFVLAQLVNAVKLYWEWRNRPKLIIESDSDSSVLEIGEHYSHYGCSVRNVGRTIATGARVQLVRIEGRNSGHEFRCLLEHA